MSYMSFTVLLLVPSTAAIVDCSIACDRCQEHNERYPEISEVYCAMCQECKDRRRERKLNRRDSNGQEMYELKEHPENCPTPPPCDTDSEHVSPFTLAARITTTTEVTTRRPCPAVPPCKKRDDPSPSPRCYLPCVPLCPFPHPACHSQTTARVRRLASESSTPPSSGRLYVYIGVPKEILEKAKQ